MERHAGQCALGVRSRIIPPECGSFFQIPISPYPYKFSVARQRVLYELSANRKLPSAVLCLLALSEERERQSVVFRPPKLPPLSILI